MRKAATPAPRKPTHQAPTHSGLSVVSSVLWEEALGVSVRPTCVQSTHHILLLASPCRLTLLWPQVLMLLRGPEGLPPDEAMRRLRAQERQALPDRAGRGGTPKQHRGARMVPGPREAQGTEGTAGAHLGPRSAHRLTFKFRAKWERIMDGGNPGARAEASQRPRGAKREVGSTDAPCGHQTAVQPSTGWAAALPCSRTGAPHWPRCLPPLRAERPRSRHRERVWGVRDMSPADLQALSTEHAHLTPYQSA